MSCPVVGVAIQQHPLKPLRLKLDKLLRNPKLFWSGFLFPFHDFHQCYLQDVGCFLCMILRIFVLCGTLQIFCLKALVVIFDL